jgi:hypothetical protein
MNARARDLKRLSTLADEHGETVKLSDTGAGHIRARFAVGASEADVILPATPSDWRNNAALVRRVLRTTRGA